MKKTVRKASTLPNPEGKAGEAEARSMAGRHAAEPKRRRWRRTQKRDIPWPT